MKLGIWLHLNDELYSHILCQSSHLECWMSQKKKYDWSRALLHGLPIRKRRRLCLCNFIGTLIKKKLILHQSVSGPCKWFTSKFKFKIYWLRYIVRVKPTVCLVALIISVTYSGYLNDWFWLISLFRFLPPS